MDSELKMNIKKEGMSVDAITDTNHEYMFEKWSESKDSEEEIKLIHVARNETTKNWKKQNQFKNVDCISCGAQNWNKQHDSRAQNKEMPELPKSRPFGKIVPIKAKTGPENKTYLSRI